MRKITKYTELIKAEFYLDSNEVLRRVNDGYHGRYKAHDEVKPFKDPQGYLKIQLPRVRSTISTAHIRWILLGNTLHDGMLIDHIDGNKLNEHSSNLREVNHTANNCNRRKRSDNTSGITGIHWSAYHGHYVIRRTIKGKRISKSRKTMDEALEVLAELAAMDSTYTRRHGK